MRAVAPPYPGATSTVRGRPVRVLRSRVLDPSTPPTTAPTLHISDDVLVADCGGGGRLAILALEIDGVHTDAVTFAQRFGRAGVSLPS